MYGILEIIEFLLRKLKCAYLSSKASSQLGSLFSFVPEVYVNILPILLDTVMDFSYHDLHVQFEITGIVKNKFK